MIQVPGCDRPEAWRVRRLVDPVWFITEGTFMRIIGAIVLLLACSGCATIITGAGQTESVRIVSEPPGATVKIDGNLVGITPTSASLTRKDDHTVVLELAGFSPVTTHIHSGFNWWTVTNILWGGIGCPIGLIVDLASGSFDTLYFKDTDINFPEEQKRQQEKNSP
jgi:hypothetical protein